MKLVQLGYIQESSDTKTREIDNDLVEDYAERMLAGDKFPPVHTRQDGSRHWLWDGYQRLAARKKAGFKDIEVIAEPGTLQDAIWESTSANKAHGLRRTNQQKQEAVIKALRYQLSLPMGKRISARQIADHVGVSRRMVDQWLERIEKGEDIGNGHSIAAGGHFAHVEETINAPTPSAERVVTGKDGKTYPVKPTATPEEKVLALIKALTIALDRIDVGKRYLFVNALRPLVEGEPARSGGDFETATF